MKISWVEETAVFLLTCLIIGVSAAAIIGICLQTAFEDDIRRVAGIPQTAKIVRVDGRIGAVVDGEFRWLEGKR